MAATPAMSGRLRQAGHAHVLVSCSGPAPAGTNLLHATFWSAAWALLQGPPAAVQPCRPHLSGSGCSAARTSALSRSLHFGPSGSGS